MSPLSIVDQSLLSNRSARFRIKSVKALLCCFFVSSFLSCNIDQSYYLTLYCSFLVGASLVKRARVLQWLVFFFFFLLRLFTHRVCTTFCERFTFTKSTQYLIVNASKDLYLEMQNPEGFAFQFFSAMKLSSPLYLLCETFFEIFQSLQRVSSIFFDVSHLNGC